MRRSGPSRAPLGIVMKAGLLALAASATAAAPGVARAQDYIQQIPATVGHGSFGHSMATDGTTLVVGDPTYSTSTTTCTAGYGAVKIFKLNAAGSWQLNQTLTVPPSPEPNNFGDWVSLRNNVLVVSSAHEDFSATVDDAGAFYVYRRTSPAAAFGAPTKVYAPTPVDEGEFTWLGGVATNGTYIAAAGHPGDLTAGKIFVYQIQGNNIVSLPTITSPLNPSIAVSGLYITTSNALVIATEGDSGGTGTPIAYQLNGTQTPTRINTGSTLDQFSDITPYMAGDGNTVVFIKTVSPPGDSGFFRPQVIKFGAAGVVSHQDLNFPVAYDGSLPALGQVSEPAMAVKENQGFFIGFMNVTGTFFQPFNFVTGFRYLSGTGNYDPAGVVRNDLLLYPNTSFANAVAFDGTYLFVGDPGQVWTPSNGCGPNGAVGAVDVLRPLTATPAGPSGSKELEPWLSETDLHMGMVVATNGTYVLAGSSMDADGTVFEGEMTLFEDVANQWQQVDRYTDGYNSQITSQGFGTSADIDGTLIAIGVPGVLTGNAGLKTGAVYASNSLFAVGPLLAVILPPAGTQAGANFGAAVALTGTTLVVGAPPANGSGGTGLVTRGAAYVYSFNSTASSWTETQALQPALAGGTDFEGFGTAVDASGNNVIVGIPNRNGTQVGAGAVQIFTLVGTQYVSGGVFSAPASLPGGAGLGSTVSIGADYAVAGSKNGGTVVVYRRTGNTWVQDTVITPGPFGFGAAVALEGTRFAAGSPRENRVYRYERLNNVWRQTGSITSPVQTFTFGTSLDIKNGLLAIGDFNASAGTSTSVTSGAAFAISITGF
jgi:hypothetical protein